MEALMHNLQQQQLQLQQQHFYVDDLINMENFENVGEPPLPPPRKYVSIFHIDGEPILPPLMTTEKRRQMQKLKEKALKIEQRIRERKQRANGEINLINDEIKSESSRSSLHNAGGGNISQRSQDYYESKLKETKESMMLLQNLIKRQTGGIEETSKETVNTACNTTANFQRDDNQEKLQKLQKSEILIYDNSTNEVIQVPADKDKKLFEDQRKNVKETNVNYELPKKPSHLLLAGVNSKGMTAIPSICLNPPTPLTVNRNMCETLSAAGSSESLIISKKPNISLQEDYSSDESFSSMITQSDKRSTRRISKSNTKPERGVSAERKPLTPVKNVSAKIQQFEAISSDTNSPHTSPEKLYKSRKACLGTTTGTMSRSATSPSIKLTNSNRSSSSRSQSLAQDSDNSPENNLVRSSSFTLEGPSKALIDHMQQQKTITENKTAVKSPLNTTRSIARKPIISPLRAHRDTVESKAKKVQKVELKSSKLKTQQKVSQSKLAQAAVASISPYNTNALTQHTTNNLYKTKRSPYDIAKTSHTSLTQTLPKTSTTQMRKSNSTSNNLAQNKSSKTKITSQTSTPTTSTASNSARTPQNANGSINQMDKLQKDKFMRLLAQQEEEHRKLQQSFEMQQKMLIEQLNREMASAQLKSPNNSYNSSIKRQEQPALSLQLQNQLNLTGFSSETGSKKPTTPSYDFKQAKSYAKQQTQQPSPSSISNNSSYVSMAKNDSLTTNSQHSSYGSHYTQTSQIIPLHNSYLNTIDHSNANTSLDISTLSTQTSPDTLCATPIIQNNPVTTTSSSSRRRLFTEMNDVDCERNNLTSRSTGSSTHSSGHRPDDSNRSPKSALTNHDSNRRPLADNSLILHAAATKINACARGFLVRRLFQTEQIQRIVQTIRDTLIFVLNLHIETMENPEESQTPANIKLKARLLQQLSSACRTLHLVFFQTSVRERMDIIARDRKRIKTKLLSMNRRR
ncbi:flocculation protein FLO11 isoform X1 [Lucilia cuprina]|uniref:flocculation protein FLO11 isoform X1 n=2 Tax=Lucilia cuprina TaxID=7375 RepID=UPI001F05502A|nr:flocculation protein FLO11 isoform X1 [Lucilia cuprina]